MLSVFLFFSERPDICHRLPEFSWQKSSLWRESSGKRVWCG